VCFENTQLPTGYPYSGLGTGTWEAGVYDYKALPRAGATEYYDSEIGVIYSYDASAKELVSYHTLQSVRAKVTYLMERGLGRAIFWEASEDRVGGGSLIAAALGGMGGLVGRANCLSYPVSVYGNIKKGMPDY
jgi:chitinase